MRVPEHARPSHILPDGVNEFGGNLPGHGITHGDVPDGCEPPKRSPLQPGDVVLVQRTLGEHAIDR